MTMTSTWNDEERYWREHYKERPYARGTSYDVLVRGYRYGYESAHHYPNQSWSDVAAEIQRNWDNYPHRGQSTWDQVKHAVRDAWDRSVAYIAPTM
jgi:hypothetical protein